MTKTERYEEAAAHWGTICADKLKAADYNGLDNFRVAVVTAIKAASCAFIAHPEWREQV